MNTIGFIFMALFLLFYGAFGIYCLVHGLWGMWKDHKEAQRRREEQNQPARPRRSSIFPDEPKTTAKPGSQPEKKDVEPHPAAPTPTGEDDSHLPPEYRKQPPGAGGAA